MSACQWSRRLALVLIAACLARVAAAEMICGGPPPEKSVARLLASRYVAVAKVEEPEAPLSSAQGEYRLVTVRNYRGNAKELSVSLQLWEDSGQLNVGDYVLVFANDTHIKLQNLCSGPDSLRQESAKRAVTVLDKYRRYPPLSIPDGRPKSHH